MKLFPRSCRQIDLRVFAQTTQRRYRRATRMFLGHDKFAENRANKMEIYLRKTSFYRTMKNKIEFSFVTCPGFEKTLSVFLLTTKALFLENLQQEQEQFWKWAEQAFFIDLYARRTLALSKKTLIWKISTSNIMVFQSCSFHCVKSICIRSFSGPCFPAFGLITERYLSELLITFLK